MKVGDLVKKSKGYNPKDSFFSGIVIEFIHKYGEPDRITVLNFEEGELETWLKEFCEVISESG